MTGFLWASGLEAVPEPTTQVAAVQKLTVETIDNHVYFYSAVDSDRCLALIRALRELDVRLRTEHMSRQLRISHPPTPIWLHINSGGGSLFDALGVADQIPLIATPIYSLVEGFCASAATLIAMSCNHRCMTPSAFMLIHQFSAMVWGTYEEFKDEMKLFDMAMKRLVDFYVGHSKVPEAEVKEILKHDSWFDAGGCVDRGFVDEIYGVEP